MLIGPIEFYKMADCCRSEVASDAISGQKVGTVQVNIVTKFEGPSSDRLGAIKFAPGRYNSDLLAVSSFKYLHYYDIVPAVAG